MKTASDMLPARSRLLLPLAPFVGFAAARRHNVLLIAVDDLNTDLGCYGHPIVESPNIDRLARRGTRFDRAYAQYPVCNPSRTSLLSGRYPETTGVLDNRTNPRVNLKDAPFLPEHLRQHGYFTAHVGKIFHPGMDGPRDWHISLEPKGTPRGREGEGRNLTGGKFAFFHWIAAEGTDEDQADGQIAREVIRLFEEKRDRPFFIGAGFHKPHDPYVAPKRYFEPYPPERIPATPGPPNDDADLPPAALPPVRHNLGPQEGREFRRAYYACISFMDAQVGKVLDALERLRLADNTVVILFGDHGLHLGEHGWWNKVTLFERSARAPLIIAGPPVAHAGQACRRTVELVDLYPTLMELNGLPAPQGLEGRSLAPLLKDAEARWDKPGYTVVTRTGKLGRSVRTERYRYTAWDEGRLGVELYDHDNDPNEFLNLAADPRYAAARVEMKRFLGGKR
ncbi:MAG: sulfatase [Acidobacteriota bacterium]